MSRTSPTQFEVMVDFMERNGDLNKPADGPQGRINTIEKWAALAEALNIDTTGTAKPVEKWKKVWSDLKNNTKRKAAKIHKAATCTGGGPACKLFLTDLEQRVLNLIGTQAATGLVDVAEVGVELVDIGAANVNIPESQIPEQPNTSPTPIPAAVETNVDGTIEDWNRPSTSQATPFRVEPAVGVSPTSHHAQVGSPRQSHAGAGVRRRCLASRRSTPLRTRPRESPDIAMRFLASEERWQQIIANFTTEHLRLRERELQQQAQWQNLFSTFLSIVEKFNKTNE